MDVENPDRLMFVEEWDSVDAVRTRVIPDPDPGARSPRPPPSSPKCARSRRSRPRSASMPPRISRQS
ncbi:hypothetical protein [Sphingopyxis soli]|uniref:hypothetical protein n=1 Tax=Sphingopyxis soli TaxID=592051 RepID=UPI0031D9F4A7